MRPSNSAFMGPRTRCRASAAAVPMRLDRTAADRAIIRLVVRDSMTKGLDRALPYHFTDSPTKSLAWRPELKLNRTMMPIGI